MAEPDFSRTKSALIGCLGLSAVAFAALFITIQRTRRGPSENMPCIQWNDAVRPLLVGDSAQFTISTIEHGSDCTGKKKPTGFLWSTPDESIVTVISDGRLRAKAPGPFTAVATRGDLTLRAAGFVLPPEWKARISPDSANLRVGDTVAFAVRAFDKNGAALPNVPYGLFTPEFFDPVTQKKPIVNRASWQDVLEPSIVVAMDTGTTLLVGRIGFQQVTAKVRISPRK